MNTVNESKVTPDEIAAIIQEAILRCNADDETTSYINNADSFLKEQSDSKPDFLDPFFKNVKAELKKTADKCIRVRNRKNSKDDLKKYKEGYFNEIVQNANDVVATSVEENPSILVEVKMTRSSDSDKVYTVKCTYPDSGFGLENIYGFCTRGNSDKADGQDGMFGIGIKSLLCFVDELSIISNINIKISSKEKPLDTVEIGKNSEWLNTDPKTSLQFSFSKENCNEGNHAGFNTEKLEKFIELFYSSSDNDQLVNSPATYLLNGKDEELLFDVRSLFFTDLRQGRTFEHSIKNITFKKADSDGPQLTVSVEETAIPVEFKNITVKIATVNIKMEKEQCGCTYLLFHDTSKQESPISLAFEYDSKEEKPPYDRLYSTYFVCTYSSFFDNVPMGCLVNTREVNSSRTALEREKEEAPAILKSIRETGCRAVESLCKLIKSETDTHRKIIYVDVLCRLLWLNRTQSNDENGELVPAGIFKEKQNDVAEAIPDFILAAGKRYVLFEEDGIEKEYCKVTKNAPLNSDDENQKNLYSCYQKYIFKTGKSDTCETDTDVILSTETKTLTYGIQMLCSPNYSCSWLNTLGLPFLKNVNELIIRRIGGSDFKAVQNYLDGKNDDDKLLIKQLVARYEVNTYFDKMGGYSDETIRYWLFDDGNSEDKEYEAKCEDFKKGYEDLHKYISKKKGELDYCPKRPNFGSTTNYNELWYHVTSHPNLELESSPEITLAMLRLIYEKRVYLANKKDFGGGLIISSYSAQKLNKNASPNATFYSRDLSRKMGTTSFVYLSSFSFKKGFSDFKTYKKARKYIDDYNQNQNQNQKESNSEFNINWFNCCIIEGMPLAEVCDVFEWLSTKEESYFGEDDKLSIGTIDNLPDQSESEDDLIRFVKRFIGDKVFIQANTVTSKNNGKKFVGFISNLKEDNCTHLWIKSDAKSEFIDISIRWNETSGQSSGGDRKFLIIYSTEDSDQYMFSEVLSMLGYEKETCQYVKHFIQTGNITELSEKEYRKFIKNKRLEYEYPFAREACSAGTTAEDLSIDDIYTILSGEMSYDDHCPFCNMMPTLNIMEGDITKLQRKNCLIAMLLAKYENRSIYVKILCCKSCFDQYKATLSSAEITAVIIDGKDTGLKQLQLIQTVSSSIRTRNITTNIILSPDNWKIISDFNKLPSASDDSSSSANSQ